MFYLDKTVTYDVTKTPQVFHIRCMTGRDQMRLYHGLDAGDDLPVERMYELLAACLIGWDYAESLRGQDLGEYAADKVEWLDARVVDFLVAKIIVMSQTTEDEKKTSSDLSPLASTPTSSDAETVLALKDATQ